ncbi:two-component sensor histidine kinase [Phytohabitans rumicis]|uniref:histidine kinase n=1 Tax=Phytohabitans rumicis TaxID=1076125 RepID=A0A6V8L4J4_9ACTN|nr:two-component sensor histidine kinase [Phytohabitans rumicis]
MRQAARAHPLAVDGALAAVLYALSLLAPMRGDERPERVSLSLGLVVAATVVCAALVFRRRWPLLVLAVTTTTVVVMMMTIQARAAFVAGVIIAAYTVATRTDRATAWIAGTACALAFGVAAAVGSDEPWYDPGNLIFVVWVGMAVAAGDAVRSRRAYVAVLEERARRAEQSREGEARRRVAEERLRIARELHDVVAHHIALVNVQAGVASHVLRDRPDQAEEALTHVRRASGAVLDELGAMLSVLRQSGESDSPTEPAPSLDRLDALVGSFTAAGLTVDWTLSGRPRPLPAAVDLAAYRIVQESLTNVHKHSGGAAARVTVGYAADGLVIDVRDDGRSGAVVPNGTGHGILGMRERAAAAGGELRAGPRPEGGFRVYARLPLPSTQEDR